MTCIRSLVRKTVKPQGPYKAFSLFWDGGFDMNLTACNLQLWGPKETTMRGWEHTSSIGMDNIHFLNPTFNSVGHDLEFDFILCNDRLKQFESAQSLAHKLHIPIIIVDHSASEDLSPSDMMTINKSRQLSLSVGCHETISKAWDCDFTIPYGIDVPELDLSTPRGNKALLHGAFHQLLPMHTDLVYQIVEQTDALLFGHSKRGSNPFTSCEQCQTVLSDTQVYINLSTWFNIPRELLLAMAHGCAVVTNCTGPLTKILDNRKNCVIVEDIEDIPKVTTELTNNSKLRRDIGANAQDTIRELFPMSKFIDSWTELLDSIKGTLYLP